MRLEEIVLHNVGVYKGRHQINLDTPSEDRPIILFGGLNGGGKTTLLDSIQLALYGNRARCSNRGKLSYEEFLRISISRSAPSREGAAIELSFRTHVGGAERSYHLHRSWAETTKGVRERFEVLVDGLPDKVLSDGWSEHVEELLPLEISSLFFFDGEKIEALADPERASAVIATSISALLGLGLLDRLQADLQVLERRKKTADAHADNRGEIDQLSEELERSERAREDGFQRQAATKTAAERSSLALSKAEEALRSEGGDLFEQRASLDAELRLVQERRESALALGCDSATGALPLALLRPMLEEIRRQGELEREASVSAAAVELLEDRDKRVLALLNNVDLVTQSKVAAHLEDDRSRLAALSSTEEVLGLPNSTIGLVSQLLEGELDTVQERAAEHLEQIARQQESVDDLDRKIAGIPDEEAIKSLLSIRTGAQRQVDVSMAQHLAATEELERLTRARDLRKADLDRALERSSLADLASDDAKRVLAHSVRVRSTVDRFKAALLERSVARVESAVLEAFNKLHRKEGLVLEIRLDPTTFELTLFGPDMKPMSAERLSAGERQLLAIAMLWGLASVAGRDLPMVIDTPLGRLDSEHRKLLVERYFPYAASQVLLLSTDEEIDEALLESLGDHVGRTYRLDYDSVTHSSAVNEGYFWDYEGEGNVA